MTFDISDGSHAPGGRKLPDDVLRTFVDALPQLAWMGKADGYLFWYNRRWHEYTGTTPESMEGWGWQSVHDPAELPRIMSNWQKSIASGEPFEMEFPLRGADGVFRPFLTRAVPVRDASGAVALWVGTNTDVSKQKQAEQVLREQMERFDVVSRATNDVVWDWNLSTDIVWWSESFGLTFGPRGSESSSIQAWAERVHPHDRDRVVRSIQEAIRSGAQYWFEEYRFQRSDGCYALVRDRGAVLTDTAGKAVRMVGAMHDVTSMERLRTTDMALRVALEAAYLVAFIWDIPKDELRRYHNSDELMSDSAAACDSFAGVKARVHPEDQATFEANVQASLRDPKGAYTSEYRWLNRRGQTRWVMERGRVEFDAAGKPLRLIGLAQDITERKASELKLLEAQRQLQRHAENLETAVAERTAQLQDVINELGSFAYSVSHDLRAPLRSIQGFSELLREDVGAQLPEGAKGYLDRVIRAAQRMDALIKDVLEYSRITRAELILEELDPGDVVREVLETHQHFRSTGAQIDVVLPFPHVCASRPALMQCLSNLVGNAVKFTRPGVPPQVRIRAEDAGERVRIWIEDSGIGIAQRDREKIWGMLERLNPSYEGTGVGLSIVRKAVERMGGSVGVESTPGEGSQFWIELPKPEGREG